MESEEPVPPISAIPRVPRKRLGRRIKVSKEKLFLKELKMVNIFFVFCVFLFVCLLVCLFVCLYSSLLVCLFVLFFVCLSSMSVFRYI